MLFFRDKLHTYERNKFLFWLSLLSLYVRLFRWVLSPAESVPGHYGVRCGSCTIHVMCSKKYMTIALASFSRQNRVQKCFFTEVKIQKVTDFFMHKAPLCAFSQSDLFQIKWKHVRKNKPQRPQEGVQFTHFFWNRLSQLFAQHTKQADSMFH